jgi:hypothetical protein
MPRPAGCDKAVLEAAMHDLQVIMHAHPSMHGLSVVPAGCEVSVLEAAMHDLQAEMHTKRREAYEQEDRLGTDNPPVFATVQTSRPTQLEQTKHCLVLHKKACR